MNGPSVTEIHFYGPCERCGVEMQDVNEFGYEECLLSPYIGTYYGSPNKDICTRCAGELYRESIDLTGRMAKCTYHTGRDKATKHDPVPSHWGLAFFQAKPEDAFDRYYCGCWGWN